MKFVTEQIIQERNIEYIFADIYLNSENQWIALLAPKTMHIC